MDTLFLISSKLVWFFLRPETVLVLLFALALVLLRRKRIAAASKVLTFALSLTIAIGVFPLGNLLLNPLERSYLARPDVAAPAGIIVLGGMEDLAPGYTGSLAQINDAGDRLIATVELARRFPGAVVLYSGGRLALTPAEDGAFEVGPDVLRQLGLSVGRMIIEGRSRTTAENAVLSRAMAPNNAAGPWVLVTSASHMPRAFGTFCAAGWRNLIPWPTDYRGGDVLEQIGWNLAENLTELNIGLKEWIGLLAYRVTGRTDAFFPKGCA